jgi:IS6 family transposase
VDKNAAYPKAFRALKAAGRIPENCELRQVKYLNNVIEQDHRFVKRLVKPGMGFFSFQTAWRTLQGYEIMNMMRKGQVQGVDKGVIVGQIAWIAKVFGVAAYMQREGHSMLILFLPHSCNTTLSLASLYSPNVPAHRHSRSGG